MTLIYIILIAWVVVSAIIFACLLFKNQDTKTFKITVSNFSAFERGDVVKSMSGGNDAIVKKVKQKGSCKEITLKPIKK